MYMGKVISAIPVTVDHSLFSFFSLCGFDFKSIGKQNVLSDKRKN